MFMLSSINWQNLIIWLPFLLEILDMCIAIIYFPGYDAINFEINLSTQAVFLYGQEVETKIKMS